MPPLRTVDDRLDLARRVARPAAVALWPLTAFCAFANVPAVWGVALLSLAAAAAALPTRAPATNRPDAWTVASFSLALAVIASLRASVDVESDEPGITGVVLVCAEAMVLLVPLGVGQRIDEWRASRYELGRGRMRAATLVAMALGVVWVGVSLSRFPGRVEARRTPGPRGSSSAVIGVYQPLGARCPPTCDRGSDGRSRNVGALSQRSLTDDLGGGASLQRDRVDAMNTRMRVLLSPPDHAPRYVFDRVIPAGQEVRIGRDPSGARLTLDYAQHPRTTVRLSDGATFTEHQRGDGRETPFHAPVAYVLTALAGLGAGAWFLSRARRERAVLDGRSEWRRAQIQLDGMVHFESELPPAPLPEGESATSDRVVVLRVTAPVGVGYRSDGVVTIHEMFRGSPEQLAAHLTARATAWEHGAFASVLVTQAPLVGVCLFGELW